MKSGNIEENRRREYTSASLERKECIWKLMRKINIPQIKRLS